MSGIVYFANASTSQYMQGSNVECNATAHTAAQLMQHAHGAAGGLKVLRLLAANLRVKTACEGSTSTTAEVGQIGRSNCVDCTRAAALHALLYAVS